MVADRGWRGVLLSSGQPRCGRRGSYENLSQREVLGFRPDRLHGGNPVSTMQVGLETDAAQQRSVPDTDSPRRPGGKVNRQTPF